MSQATTVTYDDLPAAEKPGIEDTSFLPNLTTLTRPVSARTRRAPRKITTWNTTCDKRLHRLICYLKTTRTHCLHGWVGATQDQLSIMLFADASFADCMFSSKSTTGVFAVLAGPSTFFPANAVCKKQTVVSHSSTESEI
eukprot:7468889-Pyramimonas_sp.AAC.1